MLVQMCTRRGTRTRVRINSCLCAFAPGSSHLTAQKHAHTCTNTRCCALGATHTRAHRKNAHAGEGLTAAGTAPPLLRVTTAGFGARAGAIDCVLKLASLRACAAASTPPSP